MPAMFWLFGRKVALKLVDRGNAVNANKSIAKVTFLTGTEKHGIELKPAGDKLVTKWVLQVRKRGRVAFFS